LAVGVVLAGCQSTGKGGAPVAAPATAGPSRTTTPATPVAPRRTTARPPAGTSSPAPVDAPCPYATAEQVAETVGQHITRTTVTRTRPYPGCTFYRPNGERAADVQVTVLATAAAAQAKAIALGGRGANPVGNVGDGGVVALTPTGATLAVSKGRALVVVRINQRISLEAREIAGYVIAHL
jgi:hypothetical protein